MQANSQLPVISRSESIPESGDYQYLYEQGLQWISEYSSQLWNNYNLGDPGITVLQKLCYALTELSYKTDLPISDILTQDDGKIKYDNRFVKPQDILPTSPVSLIDFKKKLLDEVEALKQVYFNLESMEYVNVFIPYLELKPDYVNGDPTLIKDIKAKVDLVLFDYSNVGQLFRPAILLNHYPLMLNGSIHLEENANVEKFIANLIYGFNEFLSPYPLFYSYEDLLEEGLRNDEIFDGPLLNGGFLKDQNFTPKRENILTQDVMVAINHIDGVEAVSNISLEVLLHTPTHLNQSKEINIPSDTVFYFDYESIVAAGNNLKIIQNGKTLSGFSKSKIQYELLKLIPVPQPDTDFDQYLPEGVFRDIQQYYSIQHHFPEIYELNKKYRNESADPVRQAKNKQFKAYLALFEQLMANYLAQLAHLGDLFSFDSGRTIYQLAGQTYFFQDIYDVPGIQDLLKDVKGYGNHVDGQNPQEDWNAYKRDHLNPYRQVLMSSIESPEKNLSRKNQVLKHLLARFGVEYQGGFLSFNNPYYGNAESATVVQLSDILKSFPLISANKGRSYFYQGSCPNTLYAGVELQADLDLSLNSYYQGLIETLNHALDFKPENIKVVYHNKNGAHVLFGSYDEMLIQRANCKFIEIYCHKKLLVDFEIEDDVFERLINEEELPLKKELFVQTQKFLLDTCHYTLERLIKQSKGFVFIDMIRLLKDFTFDLKLIHNTTKEELLQFENLNKNQLQNLVMSIRSLPKISFEAFKNKKDTTAEIWNENFKDIQEHEDPIFQQIQDAVSSEELDFELFANNNQMEKLNIPMSFIDNTVIAVFPRWISLFNEPQYKSFLKKKLLSVLPMNVRLINYFACQSDLDSLLTYFNCWMGELIAARQNNEYRCTRKYEFEETWQVLTILKNQHETTQ